MSWPPPRRSPPKATRTPSPTWIKARATKSSSRSWATYRHIAAKSSNPSSKSASTNDVYSTWNASKCSNGRCRDPANASSRSTCRCRTASARWASRTIRICWIPSRCCGTQWRKSVFTFKWIAFRLSLPRRNMAAKREYRSAFKSRPTWSVTFSKEDQQQRRLQCWAAALRRIRRRMRFRWSSSMQPPARSRCSNWRELIASTSRIAIRSRSERSSNRTSISPAMSARFWRTSQTNQSQPKSATVLSSEYGWATHDHQRMCQLPCSCSVYSSFPFFFRFVHLKRRQSDAGPFEKRFAIQSCQLIVPCLRE